MKIHLNLFHKILILIVIVIALTLFLYGRSYQNNVKLMTSQLISTNVDHLNFFAKQVDANIDQLFTNAHTLIRDAEVKDYSEIENLAHLIDQNKTKLNVLNKLSLHTSTTNLIHHISIYNLLTREVLSSDSNKIFDSYQFNTPLPNDWTISKTEDQDAYFHLYISHSSTILNNPNKANVIMELQFSSSELLKMLDQYQTPASGDIFFYDGYNHILSASLYENESNMNILSKVGFLNENESISKIIKLNGKQYMVNTAWLSSLNWHVIHISPLEVFLKPLESSRFAFYLSTIILLALSIMMSFILYKQIHRPIQLLLKAVNHLKDGDWSYRIQFKAKNEFASLNEAFNDMTSQIQQLIEKVYLEQLRVKDSYLKQLQSQINPHFLYNCLFFIKSKAKVQDYESISQMAMNLGEYYRYITRLDHSNTTLEQELNLLKNYLSVQNLRKQRIDFEIDVPSSLLSVNIPRLIIQPIVENSIIHGIEKIVGIGTIRITGYLEGNRLFIIVEDNGPGMSSIDIEQLMNKINQPTNESEKGYGLWNVQQRIKQLYGIYSGLSIEQSFSGGIKVTIRLDTKEN